jgi:hypothetical protein
MRPRNYWLSVIRGRRAGSLGIGAALLCGALILSLAYTSIASANGVPFKKGDVLADVGSGLIKHYSSTGTLLDTMETTTGTSEGDGMCFDAAGNLYATQGFGANTVSKINTNGELVEANWGSGYNQDPESCVADSNGHIFVGQPDGSKEVLEFETSGKPVASFAPPIEDRGTDWIDLASDQCTLHYTSEGSTIKAFNVCTNEALPDFASELPAPCYAHRILPNGEELVACASEALRLDSSGKVVMNYPASEYESSYFFAINLDPDGETFWTADYFSGKITRINIATGKAVSSFSAELSGVLGGIAIVGEITAPPKITLAPATAENLVGTTHTVTATVTEKGLPVEGTKVTFTVTGVNPQSGTGTTNSAGEGSFTYTGNNVGTDTITSEFEDKEGKTDKSNSVTKIWTNPVGPPKETTTTTSLSGEGQSGGTITVKEGASVSDEATITGENASSAGGTVTYDVYSESACSTKVASAGTEPVTGGKATASEGKVLPAGTYYWQATYSGDASNEGSKSACTSEVETVQVAPPPCTSAIGFATVVIRKEGETERQKVTNKLFTNLASKQKLVFTWENGASKLTLTKLTSASCTVSGKGTKKFLGAGEATVNGEPGWQVKFYFILSPKNRFTFHIRVSMPKEEPLAFTDKAATLTSEKIS